MNKKIILLILVFLSINAFIYSDIIDQVVIVRPKLTEEAEKTYNTVAIWLENSRKEELQKRFRSRGGSGGFGSGFLVEGRDSNFYIVTNYHVIAQSDFAVIEFQNYNGEKRIFENCPVVLADENIDLAILLLNRTDNETDLVGMEINTDFQTDGTDVWTAGFPGFGGEPLWQLAKGNITNQQARINKLDVNSLDYVIQHSSIIDSGSSGGPLLYRDSTNPSNFTVIGVNTWSALGRDNTYFSVPSIELVKILNTLGEEHLNKKSLELRAKSFAVNFSSIEDDFLNHRTYFSHNLIFKNGWKSYSTFRKTLSGSELDKWDSQFFYTDPFEVMKKSLYQDLRSVLKEKKLTFVEQIKNEISSEIDVMNVQFLIDGVTGQRPKPLLSKPDKKNCNYLP